MIIRKLSIYSYMSDSNVIDDDTPATDTSNVKKENLKKRWSKYTKTEDFQAEINKRPTREEVETMVEEKIGRLIEMLKEAI